MFCVTTFWVELSAQPARSTSTRAVSSKKMPVKSVTRFTLSALRFAYVSV